MIKHIKTTKHRVYKLLEDYPTLRDCDKKLWLAYMNTYHGLRDHCDYMSFKKMLLDPKTPTMESVRRVRQKIQENGEFVGERRQQRMEEAKEVKQWALEH